MDCPYCGAYNPEGRTTCWRCDRELPKPKPKKKRDPQQTAKLWLYIALAIFFVITILQTCGFRLPGSPQPPQSPQQQGPSGHLMPSRPPIVWQMERPWWL